MQEINQHDKYLLEIVQEFDRESSIIKSGLSGFSDKHYASLRLDELRSRLKYNIAWYENRGLTSSSFLEAKKRIGKHATSSNCI